MPQMHSSSPSPASCLGAALTAAYRVMGHVGGLCVFQSQLQLWRGRTKESRELSVWDGRRTHVAAGRAKQGQGPEQTTASARDEGHRVFAQIGVDCLWLRRRMPTSTSRRWHSSPRSRRPTATIRNFVKKDGAKLDELQRFDEAYGLRSGDEGACTRGLRVSAFRGTTREAMIYSCCRTHAGVVFALEIAHDAEVP